MTNPHVATETQRLPPIDDDDLTPEQRAVVDAILAGPRRPPSGRVGGPFPPLLRSPGLAGPAQELGAHLRFGSALPPRVNELAIIMTARRWRAQFEWHVHRRFAIDAGLDPVWADAIAEHRRPIGMDAEAAAVYDFVTELLETGAVSDRTYARVLERFGEVGVVDLVGAVGYYCLISFILNVDRHPIPPGGVPLPE
jgi:4-carboxymuconolactone decarboxylase